MKKTSDRIKEIIADNLGVELSRILPESRLVEDLGADSLDTVELVMKLEEEFSIEISDSNAEKIISFKDAVEFIDNAISAKKEDGEKSPKSTVS